ncbi:MAG: transporter [Actinomycetota bacterium]|nr:transporter [Actinomycetota bacterium]
MTWLLWRLNRTQLYIATALLAAFTVLLLVTGLQMASQYHSAVTACAASHSCANLAGTLFLGSHAVGFLVIMTLGVPALIGLFWGAPLVASEFETGTGQFAWMQTVTRKRWLAVTTGWTLLAAAAWGGAVSALVTWWSGPDNALQLDQFKPGRFDIMGIVPVGYALFAMALGLCAGALLRRTMPALAVTLGGFIAVRAVITLWLRPHYMSAVTVTHKLLSGYAPSGSYWQLTQGIFNPAGQVVPVADGLAIDGIPVGSLPGACVASATGAVRPTPSCRQALDGFHAFITYQPASRYWAFQGIELGVFAALAAALVAVTAVVVLRRDA